MSYNDMFQPLGPKTQWCVLLTFPPGQVTEPLGTKNPLAGLKSRVLSTFIW